MAKQFGTTAEIRNYGSVMVSGPAVANYAATSGADSKVCVADISADTTYN